MKDVWIHCGEVEFEVEVDTSDVHATVVKTIEDEIVSMKREHHQKLGLLERRLSELLALPAPEASDEPSRDDIEKTERKNFDRNYA